MIPYFLSFNQQLLNTHWVDARSQEIPYKLARKSVVRILSCYVMKGYLIFVLQTLFYKEGVKVKI